MSGISKFSTLNVIIRMIQWQFEILAQMFTINDVKAFNLSSILFEIMMLP